MVFHKRIVSSQLSSDISLGFSVFSHFLVIIPWTLDSGWIRLCNLLTLYHTSFVIYLGSIILKIKDFFSEGKKKKNITNFSVFSWPRVLPCEKGCYIFCMCLSEILHCNVCTWKTWSDMMRREAVKSKKLLCRSCLKHHNLFVHLIMGEAAPLEKRGLQALTWILRVCSQAIQNLPVAFMSMQCSGVCQRHSMSSVSFSSFPCKLSSQWWGWTFD